jgi:hypothetical protein
MCNGAMNLDTRYKYHDFATLSRFQRLNLSQLLTMSDFQTSEDPCKHPLEELLGILYLGLGYIDGLTVDIVVIGQVDEDDWMDDAFIQQ